MREDERMSVDTYIKLQSGLKYPGICYPQSHDELGYSKRKRKIYLRASEPEAPWEPPRGTDKLVRVPHWLKPTQRELDNMSENKK